jgi:hypothetical protein
MIISTSFGDDFQRLAVPLCSVIHVEMADDAAETISNATTR